MQLLCNGVFLDLYEDTKIQFTHENPLFAFDSLKCERTTQFKLPTTKKNDRIFSLARIPAYPGEGMRRKFAAQLQDGQVIKDGYLYVSAYDGKDYAAVFVTGELIGLQEIRNAGKIADIWHPADSIVWNNANVKDANTSAGQQSLAITRYKTNDTPCHPSFDLFDVINYAYQAITGNALTVPSQRGFRLIPQELQTMPKMSVTITYAGTGVDYDDSFNPTQYANVITISDGTQVINQQDQVLLIGVGGTEIQWKYLKINQFVPRQSIIITFPSDFPSDYYLMSIEDKGTDGSDPVFNYLSQDWFLGGYSFRRNTGGGTISSGTPLAGRSVEIPSGTPFIILSADAYEYQPAPFNWDGFRWINSQSYTYNLTGIVIEGKDIAVGDTVRAMDILPDLTLVELMKVYAYCVGKVLMYDETNGVSFDDLDFANWQVVNISDKLTKRGEVSRKFGDYAQHNVISFNSGNDVPVNQSISAEYTVDNDNIEVSKDIAVIPYSEGSIDADGGYIVARFDAEDTTKHKLYADGIMFCGASAFGLRISLPKNAGLQALCDASTQIQVSARMTLYEYNKITPKTLIYVDGTEYVWNSRNWQSGEAQFTLAKIPNNYA